MAEKHYDQDLAKDASRTLVGDVSLRTVAQTKKPQELQAFCMPGIDAVEIVQVYDRLGIPRANIVGIERDRSVYEQIRAKNLGIQLVHQTLETFLEQQPKLGFDIVSWDFIGPISRDQIEWMRLLKMKQTKEAFVFHSANLARRDAQSRALYMTGHIVQEALQTGPAMQSPEKTQSPNPANSLFNTIVSHMHRIGGTTYERLSTNGVGKEDKELSYSGLIHLGLSGYNRGSAEEMFNFGIGGRLAEQREQVMEYIQAELKKRGKDLDLSWEKLLETHIPLLLMHERVKLICKNQQLPQEVAEVVNDAVNRAALGRAYYPADTESYSYISSSGAPMLGNVSYLVYPEKVFQKARQLAAKVGYPRGWCAKDTLGIAVAARAYGQTLLRHQLQNPPAQLHGVEKPRIFLGNAAKPVLSKKRFLAELELGASVESIQQKYRGWDNKPLAQWKAHHTMGTYTLQMPEESPEDGDIDKITQDEALDFLKAGIPPEEIVGTFPTSFSLGQLRAFKAHLTMGTYQKRDAN